jgi:hypothetical protein
MYNTYLKIVLGERITLYPILAEIASFVGAVSSSYVINTLSLDLFSAVIELLNTISLLLMLKALE